MQVGLAVRALRMAWCPCRALHGVLVEPQKWGIGNTVVYVGINGGNSRVPNGQH